MALPDFRNTTAALLGAGVSNMPLAEFLVSRGATVTARDKKSTAELGENGEKLRSLGVHLHCGETYMDNLGENFIFRSPGFRPDLPALNDAVSRGAVLTSEMELFLENRPCPVIGITGSDGKTTTTTLISRILKRAFEDTGRLVFLGGNIGEPMLHRIDSMKESDTAVVELSSFQLMTVTAAPDVAVITNITPNHLNWHTDMDEYIAAKAKILAGCSRAVLNFENEITRNIPAWVQQVKEFCAKNISSDIMIEDLAAIANCSKWHFSRQFSLYEGISPHRYLMGLRIKLAQQLLENSIFSIKEIAEKCGFYDMAYFGKVFKSHLNVSPSEYRK